MNTGFFDTKNIFASVFGYQLSYIEFVATFFGLVSIWLATKQNICTWFTGFINIILSFIIFYQVQLYSDVFLQVYFFITNIYGWVVWRNQRQQEKPVGSLLPKTRWLIIFLITTNTLLFGFLVKNIHLLLPAIFVYPAAFPFIDTFIAISSIIGAVLLARRIIDSWVLLLMVDIISVFIYASKGILFISLEYGIFCFLAYKGFFSWLKAMGYPKALKIAAEI